MQVQTQRRAGPALTISPGRYALVIFDLDGVVTRTARVHAAAWKAMFDEYAARRAARGEGALQPFDPAIDYARYLDGKPRYDGVRSWLESRSVRLPFGDPADPPEAETVCGLGNRKNALFLERLQRDGAQVFDTTVARIRELRRAGVLTAVVSSSKNCAAVLEATGLEELFDARVDGTHLKQLGLQGKPAPDLFLEAARRLGVDPRRAVVVEDAIAGVQAGRRGGFGCVLGVDRGGRRDTLLEGGADVVVADLAEVAIGGATASPGRRGSARPLPHALEVLGEIRHRLAGRRPAVFLDYDGTLTPIVRRPEEALLAEGMREAVRILAAESPVAILSGRDLEDIRRMVGLPNLWYAGSHGFDIAGPQGQRETQRRGMDFLPALDAAERELADRLRPLPGVRVERKRFAVAVHFREAAAEAETAVERAVDAVVRRPDRLRRSRGKKIVELQPDIDWHKGRALLWLLDRLDLARPEVLPFYLGDDTTDEDAFRVLEGRGLGILVAEGDRPTAARYRLRDPAEVERFLRVLIAWRGDGGTP